MNALLDRIKREPVLLVALLLLVAAALVPSLPWLAPVIVVLGIVLRFLVSPNKTVDEALNLAYKWGLEDGDAGWVPPDEVD